MNPRPTRAQLAAATGRTVADVLRVGLDVVFCGINPGLWSAATGHHFARPGNRFWRVLALSGFTARELAPDEEDELVSAGVGITNLVPRATANAAALGRDELRKGAVDLAERLSTFRVRTVAFLGIGAYRTAFADPRAELGALGTRVGGARAFLLANPSGVQARYGLEDLVAQFVALRSAVRDEA